MIQKTFTRRTYQKGNTYMVSIPVEIAGILEINSETGFVVQLVDGMIIYKLVDTRTNSKHISEKFEKKITEEKLKEFQTQKAEPNENKILLKIVE